MRIFLSLLTLVFVGGCFHDPSAFPIGSYKAREEYKSPDGPAVRDIGYSYSAEENEKVLQIWEDVVASLVDRLEASGLQVQPLYVLPKSPENAFFLTFDHVLRQELRARGYEIRADVRGVPVVAFDATRLPEKGGEMRFAALLARGEAYADRIMAVSVWRGGSSLASVKAVYRVPVYGYDHKMLGAYDGFFGNLGKGE